MQRLSFILFLLITQVSIAQVTTDDPNLKLWYNKPAYDMGRSITTWAMQKQGQWFLEELQKKDFS